MNELSPDLDQARRFLKALDPAAMEWVFQTFDDSENKNSKLARIITGRFDDIALLLTELNEKGAGVFVTINRSKNGGRKKEDISEYRAIWREADEPNLPPLPIKPHLTVETSPGKKHEYLLIENTNPERGDAIMKTMVVDWGSDPNAKDRSRVLRVPGFHHQKKAPFLVRIVEQNDFPRYTIDEVAQHIPPALEEKPATRPLGKPATMPAGAALHPYAEGALVDETLKVANAPKGTRNATLNAAAFSLGQLVGGGALPRERIEFELTAAARGAGLPDSRIFDTIKRGIEAGMKEPRTAPENLSRNKIDKGDYLATADKFRHEQPTRLVTQQGQIYQYNVGGYILIPSGDFAARGWVWGGEQIDYETGEPFKPTRNWLANFVDAVRAKTNLEARFSAPCWLDGRLTPDAKEIISFPKGLLDITTRQLMPPTSDFFTVNVVPFDYNPQARLEALWLKFLNEIFEGDQEAIDTLQQMIGYFLSNDTSQQKIFLIVGPKRSGKGTIARLINALLGRENVAAPTLASLAHPFGLASLLGKKLAVIGDARLSGRADQTAVVERLLSISGEDFIGVARKYLPDVTVQLPTRFLLLSNELPRLGDASGALSSRFIILNLRKSFYGREDLGLTNKLLEELPSILNWALDGLDALNAKGHFVQPSSGKDALQELEDLTSPVGVFIRECCEIKAGNQSPVKELFTAWENWCKAANRHPGNLQSLGRDLRAAVPGLGMSQPRKGTERMRVWEGIAIINPPPREDF